MNREEQKQQTRIKILETADILFKQKGFANVSTRMIAKEASVGVGTVFSHFADKHELIKALFHEKIDERLMAHFKIAQKQKTALGYFLSFAQFLYGFYDEDREFSKALLQNALFDMQFFSEQMDTFVQQVSEKIHLDYPEKSKKQCHVIAKAWFGFYIFQVFMGLSDETSKIEQWLKNLKSECANLI